MRSSFERRGKKLASSYFAKVKTWAQMAGVGLVALVVLFLMAATSHDFWLSQLTAPVWKRLHAPLGARATRRSATKRGASPQPRPRPSSTVARY